MRSEGHIIRKSIMKPFIFCIGLNKTGTTSLTQALSILGWKSSHDKNKNDKIIDCFLKTGKLEVGSRNTKAYLDGMIPYYFQQIYAYMQQKQYPCKFILTQRELQSWIESRKKHVLRNQNKPDYKGGFLLIDESSWEKEYKKHYKEVEEFFQDKQNEILRMNIIEGDGWEKLCPFLGVPIPNKPFPKLNVNPRKK